MLLRHGHIASYRGDIPLTDDGAAQARAAGAWFASEGIRIARLMTSSTLRTRETADSFIHGYGTAEPDAPAPIPEPSQALRNPDVYLSGHRVNMTGTPAAFADQVEGLEEDDVTKVAFYNAFLGDPDRIGYWLRHSNPPGDTALDVGRRIQAYTRSLADAPAWRGQTIIGITHSPVLRAVALTFMGIDPGEPPYLHGYSLTLETNGALTFTVVSPGIGT